MTTEQATKDPSTRRGSRVRRVAAAACVVACGLGVGAAQAQPVSGTGPTTVPALQDVDFLGPPSVRLVGGSATLLLRPYRACWSGTHGGICYDGFPPHPLASLGGTSDPIHLGFARDGWHFDVTAVDADGQRTKIALVRNGPRDWRLDVSQLLRGRYRLDVFGTGPQGDVLAAGVVTLR